MDNSFQLNCIAGDFGDQRLSFDASHQTAMNNAVLDDDNDLDIFHSNEW